MSEKQYFIEVISEFMRKNDFDTFIEEYEHRDEVINYWETFKVEKTSKEMTDNGAKILKWLQENSAEENNMFTAKNIAEGLFINSKSVSGAMRKLVANEYVEKLGGSPVVYSITSKGVAYSFDNE